MCGHTRVEHRSDQPWTTCSGHGPLGLGGCACAGFTTEPVCDFCTRTPAPWTYPARSVAMPADLGPYRVHVSVTDWAACEECAALIEADDRVTLATRIELQCPPEHEAFVRHHLLEMHTLQFWNVRDGARYRHAPPTAEESA